jgi:small subunit ribosomal protein S8e
MVIIQARSKRKPTGGRYKAKLTKRISRAGAKPTLTKIGDRKTKIVREIGGNKKIKLAQVQIINVFDSKSKKYIKAKLETVMSNPANRHYVRRNILTKGTIVKTDKGPVKITNRPGQEANLNGILVD